jgi:hypothetical protein
VDSVPMSRYGAGTYHREGVIPSDPLLLSVSYRNLVSLAFRLS